jgi:small-conductance mechanosensitive channel
LSPEKLKGVIAAKMAEREIKAGAEPGVMISNLKQQVEQLTADLEAKERKHAADIEALKTHSQAMQDEPRRGPGRPPLNRDG